MLYGQGKCAGDGGAGTDSVSIHDGRLGGKLLKIEHGEYDSDAFMGEISSMVSGLVKTYEAVKGADVLMQPERKVIGSCPACGSDVCETAKDGFAGIRAVNLRSGRKTGSFRHWESR